MIGIEAVLGIDFEEMDMLPVISDSNKGQFVAIP
jgi:hypothetical protein